MLANFQQMSMIICHADWSLKAFSLEGPSQLSKQRRVRIMHLYLSYNLELFFFVFIILITWKDYFHDMAQNAWPIIQIQQGDPKTTKHGSLGSRLSIKNTFSIRKYCCTYIALFLQHKQTLVYGHNWAFCMLQARLSCAGLSLECFCAQKGIFLLVIFQVRLDSKGKSSSCQYIWQIERRSTPLQ